MSKENKEVKAVNPEEIVAKENETSVTEPEEKKEPEKKPNMFIRAGHFIRDHALPIGVFAGALGGAIVSSMIHGKLNKDDSEPEFDPENYDFGDEPEDGDNVPSEDNKDPNAI